MKTATHLPGTGRPDCRATPYSIAPERLPTPTTPGRRGGDPTARAFGGHWTPRRAASLVQLSERGVLDFAGGVYRLSGTSTFGVFGARIAGGRLAGKERSGLEAVFCWEAGKRRDGRLHVSVLCQGLQDRDGGDELSRGIELRCELALSTITTVDLLALRLAGCERLDGRGSLSSFLRRDGSLGEDEEGRALSSNVVAVWTMRSEGTDKCHALGYLAQHRRGASVPRG